MNAVMTAEYVVLESLSEVALEQDINEQAAKGYKLVVFTSTPSTTEHDKTYNAVMVRELVTTPTTEQTTTLHKRITILEEQLAKLDRQVNFSRVETNNRLEDIEAKIDWSK